MFSGKVRGSKGQSQTVHLFTAHSLPIKRHTKINSQVNPYDPQWELYLEQRQGLQDGGLSQRTQDLAVPLETPRWALSTLRRSDHHDHGMAQPSQGLAVAWRQ